MGDFIGGLRKLINSESMERGSDTPDFLIATFLDECLAAYDKAVCDREKWYCRVERDPRGGPGWLTPTDAARFSREQPAPAPPASVAEWDAIAQHQAPWRPPVQDDDNSQPAQPAAEPVTVAETLEQMISHYDQWQLALTDDGVRYRDTLLSLRPLVAEAEAKRRIEAAGYKWGAESDGLVCVPSPTGGYANRHGDWPSAALWAEQQAAARAEAEREAMWSAVYCGMTAEERRDAVVSCGLIPIGPVNEPLTVRVVAELTERFCEKTCRVWLGPLPMPGTEVRDGD